MATNSSETAEGGQGRPHAGWAVRFTTALPSMAAVEVEIVGLSDELQANVEAYLDLKKRGEDEALSEAAIRRLFAGADEAIRAALRPFGYYDPRIDGSLEAVEDGWFAHFEIDPGPHVVGRATVDLDAVTLTQAGHDHPVVTMDSGSLRVAAEEQSLVVYVGLDLAPQGWLEASMRAGREGPDAPVGGSIRGSVSGLDFLTLLFPGLLDVTGEMVLDLELDGTVSAPTYTGQISLVDGAAGVVATGITLEDLGVRVEGDSGTVNISGRARSGEGVVTLSGAASWSDGEPHGRFTLGGERFRFVGLPAVQVDASPDLALDVSGRDLELTGEVRIDRARIEPVDLTQALSTSPDEIVVGETPPEPERWRVSSRIAVTLGDDVRIDAYGLKGAIRGSLHIVDLPGKPATGNGELSIEDGFFNAFGQSLDIERGRLAFGGGPLGNPALDIRAVRRFETETAGVEVRSPAADPQITVFSDPPRPRQYALAMLVMGSAPVELGRPSDTLAYGSSSDRLDQSFRLGGAAGGLPTSLKTYLSPDFYLGYLEQINLRWRVSRRFTIEVSRGVETRLGIVYSRR